MLLSIPLEVLRCDLEYAFKELVVGCRYTTNIPNTNRLHEFLTDLKDKDEDHKLPDRWLYIQFKRNALVGSSDQDLFRHITLDTKSTINDSDGTKDINVTLRDDWGFASVELEFWMCSNNSNVMELAEALFYCRVFNVRTIRYNYLDIDIKSRVVHEAFQTYEPLEVEESGTCWTTTWRSTLDVPFLKRERQVHLVERILFSARKEEDSGEEIILFPHSDKDLENRRADDSLEKTESYDLNLNLPDRRPEEM